MRSLEDPTKPQHLQETWYHGPPDSLLEPRTSLRLLVTTQGMDIRRAVARKEAPMHRKGLMLHQGIEEKYHIRYKDHSALSILPTYPSSESL